VNEGYKQASEISRNLILTFIFGIVIGTVIGWGARSTIVESPPVVENPPQLSVAQDVPPPPLPAETPPSPPAPAPAPAVEPVITPTPAPAPDVEVPPFDADVAGLWPAAHLFTGIKGAKADVDTLEWLNEFKPGGVVLGPENVTDALQLSALVLQIKQATGLGTKITDPPLIIFNDPEHALPRLLAVEGDGSEKGLNPDAAAAQAREGLKQGVGVYFGPAMDVFNPGVSEARLELTTLGSSNEAVVGPGLAYINQLNAAGLMAVAREFPGAGLAVNSPEGVWHIPAEPIDALAASMEPFKAAVDAGAPGMLVGHMAVPGIDKERPNRPAALSPKLLQLLVRQDWQYQGLLIASDITRHPMTRDLPRDEIALKALFSGCDAVILQDVDRATLRAICDTFVRLAKRSDFPVDQFAASRQRMKDSLGRMGTPVSPPAQAPVPVVAEAPAPEPAATPTPEPAATPAPEAAPTTDAAPTPVPAPETVTAVTPAPEAAPTTEPAPAAEPAPEAPREHTIVKGDSLNALAKRYGVSAADLRAWNKLESDVVKIGQVIKIQAPAAEAAPATTGAEEKPAEATPVEDKPAAPAEAAEPETPTEPAPAATAAPETPTEPAPAAAAAPETPTEPAPAEAAAPETPTEPAPAATAAPELVPVPATPSEEEKPKETAVPAPQPPDTDKREHTVASGESLGAIAGMYGVTVAEIQSWNGLSPEDTVINAGDSLVVYLPVAEANPETAPAEAVAPSEPEEAEVEKPAVAEPAPGTYQTYEVVAGDNLRRIAMRFGTTQQKLIEMNNLKSADLVQIGWKLKVPKQAEAPISGSTP